ncbi:MAG: hypothetical protein KatS3mg024_1628 [Armatimonadota bacterium]|nr:MAG: hypothetical protein KatS3mg024_1628 [Armatimonadota bacterium]
MRLPFLVIIFILLVWLWAWATAPLRGGLVLECLDAGPGQCWIIHTPSGSTVVVNCGSADPRSRPGTAALRALARLGVNRLDAIILTRTEPDAASGVAQLLEEMPSEALLCAGDPAGLLSGSDWQPLRPGMKMRLRDGLEMEAYGSGGQVECLAVRWKQVRVALVDRLSSGCGRFLATFGPHALALSYAASREPSGVPPGLAPAVAVLSSGRSRATWADYGLRRSLEGVAETVCNTGRDGGVWLCLRGSGVEIRTARQARLHSPDIRTR